MIPVRIFAGRDVAVFGLGLSGIAASHALAAGGARVLAWDDTQEARDKAAAQGVTLHDLAGADSSRIATLVLAPGIPLTHPEPHWSVMAAQAAGVEVIGDTELFFREKARQGSGAKVVVITGTNGKSTTTALTAHLLQVAGRPVALGGNIGRAVLDLPPFTAGLTYVLELSTFQINLTPSLAPDAAALINITADHLDRHGTIENYAAIKARVFAGLPPDGTAVIGVDDDYSRAIADGLHGPYAVKRIAVGHPVKTGVWAKDGMLTEVENGVERGRVGLDGIGSLRGRLRAGALPRARRFDHRQGARDLCWPRPPHGAGGAARVRALRQRLKGHQCRCRRQGAGELHRHLLDCRREAESRWP
jgi:UDP-N-acetylmuramoylalanine--D-glutamate ligase